MFTGIIGSKEENFVKVLTHHGGPEGFNDIQKAIDQHQRVIARYMGVEADLPAQGPGEELLRPPFTLRTYAQVLFIPAPT